MLSTLHVKTAEWVNKLDCTRGRQVWFNYRETRITYEKSYLVRLNYVHQNAVKHGLIGGDPVSMVFSPMVRVYRFTGDGEAYIPVQDEPIASPDDFACAEW